MSRFVEASRKLAERMMTEGGTQPAERIDYAYRLVLARPAEACREASRAGDAGRFRDALSDATARPPRSFWSMAIRRVTPSLDARELAAYTSVASLILNLDETITKE